MNALSEGINLKIRAITHRSFGVPNPNTLIAMIFLGCGGIEIPPPYTTLKRFHQNNQRAHKTPSFHHVV